MLISVCVTTRNRTQNLEKCLYTLWRSDIKPALVVVSDDSSSSEIQNQNREVVKKYPNTTYIVGPMIGVCANRNNAVNSISPSETDFIAFVDDDVYVNLDFISCATQKYEQMNEQERSKTILSGVSRDNTGKETVPTRLSFRGYFRPSKKPEAVAIHAALFPRSFFELEQWDEDIYFGYEDAELCLRAMKNGFTILHCSDLKVLHSGAGESSLNIPHIGNLTEYEINIEAARLYVGFKRYKDLFPNFLKLSCFATIYFVHMFFYLLRKRSLKALPIIVGIAKIRSLYTRSSTGIP
ncbi:MAG: glycosyltransferase [Leptolyngbya sp.]|nr:MAG: glycosyltransferase [Leptolyngbya sp.]